MVAKTDCEIYVLSIISYFENRYHHAKVVEKKIMNFSLIPYCTLLLSRKENIKFSEAALELSITIA